MSTSAEIGLRPIATRRRASQSGEGPFCDAAKIPTDEQRAGARVAGEFEVYGDRRDEAPRDRRHRQRLQLPQPLGRQIAGDAAHAERIRPVRRHLDMKHRIIEAERHRRRRADRQVAVKIDDALMLVGQSAIRAPSTSFRSNSTPRMTPFSRSRPVPGICVPGGAKMPTSGRFGHWARRTPPGPRPAAVSTSQNPQAIGIGMRPRLDHPRHGEGRERLSRVADALDLEADADQPAAISSIVAPVSR